MNHDEVGIDWFASSSLSKKDGKPNRILCYLFSFFYWLYGSNMNNEKKIELGIASTEKWSIKNK